MDRANGPPIVYRPLTAADAALLKQLRLAALRDAPTAFGSTYAREAALTDAEWQNKAAAWNNRSAGMCWIALAGRAPVGIAAGYVRPDEPATVWLASMWVAPPMRGCGIARELIAAIEARARTIGANRLDLEVTESNAPAIALYRSCGFTATGERQVHPSHPAEMEIIMSKSIA